MDEINNLILKKYNYLIKKDSNGREYVNDELIEGLLLSYQEKGLLRLAFRSSGIEIIKSSKEEIKKRNRSDRAIDFNYGKITSDGLSSRDKPAIAKIIYEGEEIVFEDYDDLDNFILYEFIPSNVHMKKHKSKNSKEFDFDKPYPSISLSDIVKLKLSEKEVEHVIELLLKNNIRIGGTSQDIDSEFINYDYIRTYKSKSYSKPLSNEEEREKFLIYKRTHDPVLREELIIRNLRLVPYVAWKMAFRHDIAQEEIESYGYEGLVYAIDGYDPLINVKFASYAIPCIEGYIKKSIPKIKNVSKKLYYAFQNARYIIEKEWDMKYDGDNDMLDEIIDLMIMNGTISEKARREVKRMFARQLSYDELQESDIDITTDNLDNNLDKELFSKIISERLNKALDTLTDREKDVILMRFGFKDGHQYFLEEVGRKYNLTAERIRQIEMKAIRKLRHPSRSREIRLLWDYDSLGNESDINILYDNNEGDGKKHI